MKSQSWLLVLALAGACGGDDPVVPADSGSDATANDGSTTGDSSVVDGAATDAAVGDGSVGGRCPATGTCDLVTSTGCAAGQGCYFAALPDAGAASLLCLPPTTATGAARGATCQFVNDCMPGLGCFGGVCAAYCCSEASCGAGSTCAMNPGDPFGVCIATANCDIVAHTGCPEGQVCDSASRTAFACRASQTGGATVGMPCGPQSRCQDWLVCAAPAGGTNTCTQPCSLTGSPATCMGGQVCARLEGSGIGVCVANPNASDSGVMDGGSAKDIQLTYFVR